MSVMPMPDENAAVCVLLGGVLAWMFWGPVVIPWYMNLHAVWEGGA